MKALVITRFGVPGSSRIAARPRRASRARTAFGESGSGRLEFCRSASPRAGGYRGTPKPPLIAGREFAGVELTANGESSVRRVMGYTQLGRLRREDGGELATWSGPCRKAGRRRTGRRVSGKFFHRLLRLLERPGCSASPASKANVSLTTSPPVRAS